MPASSHPEGSAANGESEGEAGSRPAPAAGRAVTLRASSTAVLFPDMKTLWLWLRSLRGAGYRRPWAEAGRFARHEGR